MKRRKTLQVIGAASVSASVAGCSGLLGGCGPGEDEIGTVAEEVNATEETVTAAADSETVSITGEIQSLGERDIVIDDGTGTAKLTTLFGRFTARNISEGDCAQATGYPYTPTDDGDADIGLLVENIDPAG